MQNTIKRIFQEYRLFLGLFALYILLGGVLLTQIEKGDFVLWANSTYEPIKNLLFKYITHLGDGLFFLCIIILFLFIRYYHALMLVVNFVVTGLSIIALKILFGIPRPLLFFTEKIDLQTIEGVKLHKNYSFLSGHSALAFSLFLGLTLIFRHQIMSIFFFMCALLVTFSRIYLAQHFFVDTYFGAIWGVFLAIFTYVIF